MEPGVRGHPHTFLRFLYYILKFIQKFSSQISFFAGGPDFHIFFEVISFPIGSRDHDLVCVHIYIVDDQVPEKAEYFSVHVKIVDSNAWACGSSYINVHIYDNDGESVCLPVCLSVCLHFLLCRCVRVFHGLRVLCS